MPRQPGHPFLCALALAAPMAIIPSVAPAQNRGRASCPARRPTDGASCRPEARRCSYPNYNFCTCSRTPVYAPGADSPFDGILGGGASATPVWWCYRFTPNMGPLAPPELIA